MAPCETESCFRERPFQVPEGDKTGVVSSESVVGLSRSKDDWWREPGQGLLTLLIFQKRYNKDNTYSKKTTGAHQNSRLF